MKTLKNIGFVLLTFFLFLACDDSIIDIDQSFLKKNNPKKVEVPFKSKFITTEGLEVSVFCDQVSVKSVQIGSGTATHLGKFTTEMSFCFNVTQSPDFGNYTVEPGDGYFTAANGDKLYFIIPDGKVMVLVDNSVYWGAFHDKFIFTGGTGRFKGAAGGGYTNSFVIFGVQTDHEWNGTLTMVKGSK